MTTKLMAQKVPTQSVLLAREMVKAEADRTGALATGTSVPAYFAAALDLLRLVLIEIGQLKPEVGEEGHPLIAELLDRLRLTWAEDDTERALVEARGEAARWRRAYADYLKAQRQDQEEQGRILQELRSALEAEGVL